VFAARIVEAVDVFEEGEFDLLAGLPVVPPDQFCLQRLEEAFDGRIVVTITPPTHGHLKPVLAQKLLIVVGAVLRSAIRVMNAAWWRPSDRDGHVQSPQGKILLHAVADGPADDSPREKINDHSQIDPALPRPDIGNVARPLLVRPARCEILLQEIRRYVEGMIAVGASSGKRSPGSFSDPPPP